MKLDIHVKRSIEGTESNEEQLTKYLSSSLSSNERSLIIDTARWCRNVMRKARNKSATSAIGIPSTTELVNGGNLDLAKFS